MANKKRTTKFYRENEEEVMKRLGLKPTKNSGAGWIEKEDGYNEFLLSQLKSTDAGSISVKLKDIHILEYNAVVSHKIPVFVIQFLQTGELFVMAKPADLPSVAKYLECGSCDIIKSEVVADVEDSAIELPKEKVIKSGNRKAFWDEKEKEWENGKRGKR